MGMVFAEVLLHGRLIQVETDVYKLCYSMIRIEWLSNISIYLSCFWCSWWWHLACLFFLLFCSFVGRFSVGCLPRRDGEWERKRNFMEKTVSDNRREWSTVVGFVIQNVCFGSSEANFGQRCMSFDLSELLGAILGASASLFHLWAQTNTIGTIALWSSWASE